MLKLIAALGSIFSFLSGLFSAFLDWRIFRSGEQSQKDKDTSSTVLDLEAERQADVNSAKGDTLLQNLKDGGA